MLTPRDSIDLRGAQEQLFFSNLSDDSEHGYNFLWSNLFHVITMECNTHIRNVNSSRQSRTDFKFKQDFSGSRIQIIRVYN